MQHVAAMVIHIRKNLLWQRAANFLCMRSSLLESVLVTEFQTTEAYSNFDLTKAKYSVNKLSMVEKEKVIVRINPNNLKACENK
jgi:hypothetical protein